MHERKWKRFRLSKYKYKTESEAQGGFRNAYPAEKMSELVSKHTKFEWVWARKV